MAIGVLATLGFAAAFSFSEMFASLHGFAFEAGSWAFPSSATLLRLFPSQFWQDALLWTVVCDIVACLILIAATSTTREIKPASS
jgi:uncharacterized membrane protein